MNKNGFQIKDPKKIPYLQYDKTIKKTILYGAESRKINPVLYAFKRLRNYLLLFLSMTAPFNNWRVRFNKWKGVNIGRHVYIGMFVFFDNAYPEYIYIEDKATVNAGSMIITHLNPSAHFESILTASVNPVTIKEGAFVAVKSIILPGVTIGEFSIVTAGSVVSKNVEPYNIIRGNPAVKVADFSARLKNGMRKNNPEKENI
ncbi:MAG: acyltransferase [Bacteroidales bacterium]|nr:acyltransferase [Bacteroidales bacterium]